MRTSSPAYLCASLMIVVGGGLMLAFGSDVVLRVIGALILTAGCVNVLAWFFAWRRRR